MPRVVELQCLDGWTVRLGFKDGLVGDVDLSYLLEYGHVFEPLRDPAYFRRVQLDKVIGTIVWPNGADVAPETLYELARQRQPQRS